MEVGGKKPYRISTAAPARLRTRTMTNRAGLAARVLVAESDFVRRRLLAASLDAAGACSSVAENGDEAMRMIAADAPDVLLLDIGLTRPSSLELLRAIRRGANAQMHVVCITHGGHADLRAAATSLGVAAFVQTPFDPADLAATLQTLVA
jgi:two-component system, OmpR family, KDP operon response regulator KdpE